MKSFKAEVENGKRKLSTYEIIVCGIVRNCGRNLKRNIPIINQLCDFAKNYHVVMFENDSIDDTKLILQQWSNSRKNIHISTNDYNTVTIPPKSTTVNRFFSRPRIEKMANYRNQYLEYIDNNNLNADYVIVVDMDVRTIDLNGILHSFGINQQWDALIANGYIYSPSAKFRKRYNDTYALVERGNEDTPQTEESINQNQYRWAFLKKGLPLIPVYSGFGGLAIYKYQAIKNIRYQVLNNNDTRVEVRCEHYSIYKQMAGNGYNNIFINPNMRLKYQPYIFDKLSGMFKSKKK